MTCLANFKKEGYSMSINEGGVVLSSVTSDMPEYLIIPDSIEYEGFKYPVTTLGTGLYEGHDEIKRVNIPATITSIGNMTFSNCNNLKEIIIEKGNDSIVCSINSFYKSPIEYIYIGRELMSKDGGIDKLFDSSLKCLTIGPEVSILPHYYCPTKRLNCLTIEDSQKPLVYTTQFCADTIYIGRNMVSDGSSIHGALTGECKSLKFGTDITNIYNYYFTDFSIREFILPATITSLKRCAFHRCRIDFFKIELSENPLMLDSYDAFYRAEIDSLYIGRQIVYTDNSYGAFTPKTWFLPTRNSILKYVFFEDNVTNIGMSAFEYCDAINFFRFSPFIEMLPTRCFYKCGILENMIMPTDLKIIGNYAFSNSCIKIADFSNTKLETIGDNAFRGANFLTKLIVPSTIRQICNYAFVNCTRLHEIIINSEIIPVLNPNAFDEVSFSNIILKVPQNVIENYKSDLSWGKFRKIEPIDIDCINEVTKYHGMDTPIYNTNGHIPSISDKIIIVPTIKGYKKILRK